MRQWPRIYEQKNSKVTTDIFDTRNKRKFWLTPLMQTAGFPSHLHELRVKISARFSYRIYPFYTFNFFSSCIRGRRLTLSAAGSSKPALVAPYSGSRPGWGHEARAELLHLQFVGGGRPQLPRALLPHQVCRVRHGAQRTGTGRRGEDRGGWGRIGEDGEDREDRGGKRRLEEDRGRTGEDRGGEERIGVDRD